MVKKSFFRRRTPAKIQGLDLKVVESPKNLSRKIEALNPRTEGIITAPETSHAVKATIDEALKCKKTGEKKSSTFSPR